MADLDDIAEVLAVYEVHVGFPDKRRELAGWLLGEAVSIEDIEAIGDHCIASVAGGRAAAARVLVSLLLAPAKREARLADLGVVRAAQAKQAAARCEKFGDRPAEPGPIQGETTAEWERDRQCRLAFCRHVADRQPVEAVALELGVAVELVGAMVERGKVLQDPRLADGERSAPATAKIDPESPESLRAFRSRMMADQRAQRSKPKKGDLDWQRIEREKGTILAQIRDRGVLDLATVLRDKTKRGALATLEADGWILRNGPPDDLQMQPYRVAADEAERKQFQAHLEAWNLRDVERPRTRKPEGAST